MAALVEVFLCFVLATSVHLCQCDPILVLDLRSAWLTLYLLEALYPCEHILVRDPQFPCATSLTWEAVARLGRLFDWVPP
jgi:hypothetical protein